MKRLNRRSTSPFLLRRPAPASYIHPPFFIFQIPLPTGEVFKIYSSPSFKEKRGGPNYDSNIFIIKFLQKEVVWGFLKKGEYQGRFGGGLTPIKGFGNYQMYSGVCYMVIVKCCGTDLPGTTITRKVINSLYMLIRRRKKKLFPMLTWRR